MFKVMCIADKHKGVWLSSNKKRTIPGPDYGENVTVIGEDKHGYLFLEYNVGEGFSKKWFIPLSETDETEMIREQQTVNI